MTRKKIALISLAVGLALGLGALALLSWWNATGPSRDPAGAALRGMDQVMDLPDPLDLGFLGAVEAGQTTYQCSGSVQMETGEGGLRVCLRDCDVGTQTDSWTFSLYADPTQAAALLDGVWRGVDLTRPLDDQAGADYQARLSPEDRAQAQEAADGLRQALSAVTAMDFAAERQALADFMAGAEASAAQVDGGWLLSFYHFDTDLATIQPLAQALSLPPELLGDKVWLQVSIDGSGVATDLALQGHDLTAQLDLGSAHPQRELSPRLEAQWTGPDGQSWSVTLAFTVDQGQSPVPPAFETTLLS